MTNHEGDLPAMPSTRLHALGLSMRQAVALTLRVPDSGTPWIDDMIRRSLRAEFAKAAMQGICGDGIPGSHHKPNQTAADAASYADALLAELEKGR